MLSINGAGAVSYVQSITVGDHPQSIAITPNGRQAFVFKPDTGNLRILSIDLLNNVTDTGTEITVNLREGARRGREGARQESVRCSARLEGDARWHAARLVLA